MKYTDKFYNELLDKAAGAERKRMNYDLRTSAEDSSQRMLNAILPESVVPVHRHRDTSESVVCLKGCLTEIFYEEVDLRSSSDATRHSSNKFGSALAAPSVMSTNDTNSTNELKETARFELKPGCLLQIPAGTWHTVIANEPSVIFESKDGAFAPALPEDNWSSN